MRSSSKDQRDVVYITCLRLTYLLNQVKISNKGYTLLAGGLSTEMKHYILEFNIIDRKTNFLLSNFFQYTCNVVCFPVRFTSQKSI